jgi:hypothetical protein
VLATRTPSRRRPGAIGGTITRRRLQVAAEALIGARALARRTMVPAVTLGLVLTLALWVLGQQLGGLNTGQATDPNTGPMLALMAVAILSRRR